MYWFSKYIYIYKYLKTIILENLDIIINKINSIKKKSKSNTYIKLITYVKIIQKRFNGWVGHLVSQLMDQILNYHNNIWLVLTTPKSCTSTHSEANHILSCTHVCMTLWEREKLSSIHFSFLAGLFAIGQLNRSRWSIVGYIILLSQGFLEKL